MFRFIFFLLIVLALGFLFAWIADNPGTVFVQWDWLAAQMGRPGEEIGISITLAMAFVIGLIALVMFTWALLKGIFGFPSFMSKFMDNRRREKGYKALSQGLIAASSGDVDTARNRAKQSGKLLGSDPLVALLGTQTALLEGKRDEARENYQKMLADDSTRLVALRGLFLEAERQNAPEAARHYAEEAVREAPALPWAGGAKLRYEATDGDWDSAIQTLEANRSAGLIDKQTAKRHRAVLLTAKAMSVEQAEPDTAKKLTKEAHKLAKDLVPAATTYARAASRLGDIGGASKIIEATWKIGPHPELAEAYATVRAGDSVKDRLDRAKKLSSLKANHPEGSIAVANAAIDARDWELARKSLEPVLTSAPTRRACLMMADIEEGQHGDQGRMRDWLARAVRAQADEAWTADGHISDEWLPVSPITGELDAFEWKVPVEELDERETQALTVEELREAAIPIAATAATTAAVAGATSTATASEGVLEPGPAIDGEVVEAEIVETVSSAESKTEAQANTDAKSATAVTGEKPQEAEKSETDVRDAAKTAEAVDAEKKVETAETEANTADATATDGSMKKEADSALKDAASETSDNVVSLEEAAAAREETSGDDAVKATVESVSEAGDDAKKMVAEAVEEGKEAVSNQVKFPLDRRPDDPGVHPDKEPPKKGFKLF